VSVWSLRVVLAVTLVPFLALAVRDEVLHWTLRRPPVAERLLHLLLGLALASVIGRAFAFDRRGVLTTLLVFLGLGAIDEFVFHRGLPAGESDTHAKEHLALLIWLAVFEALATLAAPAAGVA
jgi:hypothetical protein